jgi:hypothetical protein
MATRELARIDIHELMRLAREGDREARGELTRGAAERHLYEMAELGEGYIEHDVEQILLLIVAQRRSNSPGTRIEGCLPMAPRERIGANGGDFGHCT